MNDRLDLRATVRVLGSTFEPVELHLSEMGTINLTIRKIRRPAGSAIFFEWDSDYLDGKRDNIVKDLRPAEEAPKAAKPICDAQWWNTKKMRFCVLARFHGGFHRDENGDEWKAGADDPVPTETRIGPQMSCCVPHPPGEPCSWEAEKRRYLRICGTIRGVLDGMEGLYSVARCTRPPHDPKLAHRDDGRDFQWIEGEKPPEKPPEPVKKAMRRVHYGSSGEAVDFVEVRPGAEKLMHQLESARYWHDPGTIEGCQVELPCRDVRVVVIEP